MRNELVRMWEETVMILHNTPALAWTDREETRNVRQHSRVSKRAPSNMRHVRYHLSPLAW